MADSMEQAGEILKGALGKLARREDALEWVQAVWPVVLGSRVAARARPVAWRDGVLEVDVRSAAWQRELEAMAARLCAEINRAWGGQLVREMRFTSGEAPARTPFVRRGAQRRKPRTKR
jgi:predicted nucleic acid-binding Zn ribbon protein